MAQLASTPFGNEDWYLLPWNKAVSRNGNGPQRYRTLKRITMAHQAQQWNINHARYIGAEDAK